MALFWMRLRVTMDHINLAFISGMLGNLLFGVKSAPQVIKCYKSKSTTGLSLPMLILDFFGNTLCAYYIFANTGVKLFWQYINYFLATLLLIILFAMMFKYKGNSK